MATVTRPRPKSVHDLRETDFSIWQNSFVVLDGRATQDGKPAIADVCEVRQSFCEAMKERHPDYIVGPLTPQDVLKAPFATDEQKAIARAQIESSAAMLRTFAHQASTVGESPETFVIPSSVFPDGLQYLTLSLRDDGSIGQCCGINNAETSAHLVQVLAGIGSLGVAYEVVGIVIRENVLPDAAIEKAAEKSDARRKSHSSRDSIERTQRSRKIIAAKMAIACPALKAIAATVC